MRAAVITPYFVDHDAVCNDVYHSVAALRAAGWEARVFAAGGDSRREEFLPLDRLAGFVREPGDAAYFHFSTGHRPALEAVAALPGRKWLKFHNVTPPEFFSVWSDELAEASRRGQVEMPAVAALPWDVALGDSSHNLAAIAPWLPAATRRGVVAPFHETESLLALRPPSAAARGGTPRLLCVGRLVQSKGHAFLLRVMRYLVHDLATPVMLDLVGKPDARMLAYVRMLALMVREYRLEAHVTFHGEVEPATLAALYHSADAFVITSEHEGFCVPLVEAMAFGVPVVTLGTSAVPETVGDAGLVWQERDPRLFALAVKRLLETPEHQRTLAAAGRRRYEEHFTNARIAARFRELLA